MRAHNRQAILLQMRDKGAQYSIIATRQGLDNMAEGSAEVGGSI